MLVERHYGAFFRLAPGAKVDIGGETFAVVGVVEIQEGSQIVASNFYMDIDEARRLAGLPPDLVNQVFLKLADMAQTETVKNRIAAWLPQASVTSPGTMLQLFGGVSQTIGRFRSVAVAAGALAALALSATLVFGNLVERRRELAILRVIGWEQQQVRREIAVEMALQGLFGGILARWLARRSAAVFSPISPSCCRRTCLARTRRPLPPADFGRRQPIALPVSVDDLGLAARSIPGRSCPRHLRLVDVGGPQGAKPLVGDQSGLSRMPA